VKDKNKVVGILMCSKLSFPVLTSRMQVSNWFQLHWS